MTVESLNEASIGTGTSSICLALTAVCQSHDLQAALTLRLSRVHATGPDGHSLVYSLVYTPLLG